MSAGTRFRGGGRRYSARAKIAVALLLAGCTWALLFGYGPRRGDDLLEHPYIPRSYLARPASERVLPAQPIWRRPGDREVVDLQAILRRCDISKYYAHECLEFLQRQDEYLVPFIQAPDVPEPPACRDERTLNMLVHMYWMGPWTKHVAVAIKSFVYSQPPCARLWVWVDGNASAIEQFRAGELTSTLVPRLGRAVELKLWNSTEQLDAVGFADGFDWRDHFDPSTATVAFSDMVRFVVLHNYGGMYVDADVIFLRDMLPMYNANFEFSGQWGFRHAYNTAVLRMFARGPTSRLMIERGMRSGMKFHPMDDITLYAAEAARGESALDSVLVLLPTHVVDPLWVWFDGSHSRGTRLTPSFTQFVDAARADFRDSTTFVNGRQPENFFTGAFLYHTHNFWEEGECGADDDVLRLRVLPSSAMRATSRPLALAPTTVPLTAPLA
ncbi:MAG: hypothetical protein BJ554DRAFT_7749 [Olpidium bornovanus]|uniref:Uncharacterized protein n=1 Tax=Olpidium bornovanus TaxID=278681 RepID=A0A8H7ZVE1_9FUNG|nr:MAG: hypothetical protein BJ554DRAFT_7749 [Olpidium bornovanus]